MTTTTKPTKRAPKRRRPQRPTWPDDTAATLLRQRLGDWFARNVIRKENRS